MALILIVDDIAALADQYAYDLRRVGGHDTIVSTSGKDALEKMAAEAVDCVILDLEMPGMDGFEVLRTARKIGIEVPIIVYTGAGNFDRCVQAVKLGAYSFIDKSEPMEQVAVEVDNALERVRLEREVRSLQRSLGPDTSLIGTSRVMQDLQEQIGRVAAIPSPVLIVGESGTGKEVVARELHRLYSEAADRKDRKRPFVAMNCAALSESLVESELFGHERGAFTGANRLHKGAFEQASGGTLFLDEIGELPHSAQAKLLRVLEQREVTRVGGERTIKVDARVVAATNRDLETESDAGRFRRDLYFRLNVHMLRVPPLRERRSDVAELAKHFVAVTCTRFGVRRKRLSPEAIACLAAHHWSRNNVRELRNIVERMIIATDADQIGLDDVPSEIAGDSPTVHGSTPSTFHALKTEAERQIVVNALEHHDWHISKTAAALGLADHSSLLKIMRRHNLKRQ